MAFIQQYSHQWPIEILCQTLGVTRAGYYRFIGRQPSIQKVKSEVILGEIREIRTGAYMDSYGSPRMHRELVARGVACSVNTVAKAMRAAGIQAARKGPFRVKTTDSDHSLPVAENLLGQNFQTAELNEVWLTDFTYLKTLEGWTYLCSFIDLHSRKVIGWATSRHIDSELAMAALRQAYETRLRPTGVIVHSDRGSQYASNAFRYLLTQCRMIQSMSRRGNCYDNAPMESFFKTYKTEETGETIYATHEEATRAAIEFIEKFYNPKRLHSSIGYLSPIAFEEQLLKASTLAAPGLHQSTPNSPNP